MEGIPHEEHGAQQPLDYAAGGLDPHLAYPGMLETGYIPDLGPEGATAAVPTPAAAAAATAVDTAAYATGVPGFIPETSNFLAIMAMAYSHSPGTPQHTLAEMFKPLMSMAMSMQVEAMEGEGALPGGVTPGAVPQQGGATPATEPGAGTPLRTVAQAAGAERRRGRGRPRGNGSRQGRGRGAAANDARRRRTPSKPYDEDFVDLEMVG